MTLDLYLLDSRELVGHEDACRACVAPWYRPRPGDDEEDMVERLASGLLLRHVFGVTKDTQVAVASHGKPFLIGGRPPYFNISNDQGLCAMAVADDIVGVDVQTIEIADEPVMRRYFPTEVHEEFVAAPDEEKPVVFAWHWTRLESRLKCLGTGLDADFRHHPEILEGYFMRTERALDGYMVTCAARRPFEQRTRYLSYRGSGELEERDL